MLSTALLRVATAGSVDDGKSTLVGRLLYDTHKIYEDQLVAVEKYTEDRGGSGVDLALLTDGLKAEREQGITIDVAYRYFSTTKRKFILADTPGHEQYTRNMVTGASTSDVAIVLVDARHGFTNQSRRHLLIASLLGMQYIIVAVNKMDLVGFDEGRFKQLEMDLKALQDRLDIKAGLLIPISALNGDNVVERSKRMSWYEGEALLPLLEKLPVQSKPGDPRFPVQWVCRPQTGEHPDYRSYTGRLMGGIFRVGDRIAAMSSGEDAIISAIDHYDGQREQAGAGDSVALILDRDIDISRGEVLVLKDQPCHHKKNARAMLCWFSDRPSERNKKLLLCCGTQSIKCMMTEIEYRVQVVSLLRQKANKLRMNDLAAVQLLMQQPATYDHYADQREFGHFILIDPQTNDTLAAGMFGDSFCDGLEWENE